MKRESTFHSLPTGIFCMLVCCLLIFFSNSTFLKNSLRVSNSLDPDQEQSDLGLFGPRHEKTCLRGFGNNTGADQPAHTRSLISAFVIHF